MATVEFSYVCVRPFQAEHPLGSGEVVSYQPGDVVPAADWGRAADNLVYSEKLTRLAVNVQSKEEQAAQAEAGAERRVVDPADPLPESEPPAEDEGSGDEQDGAAGDDGADLPGDPDGAGAGAEDDGVEATVSFPRHLGGGMYELSSGAEVKGKSNAEAAEAKLAGA